VGHLCDEIIITEDHKAIGELIAKMEPNAIFGTQMERHVAKRLNIPCGVISAPVHIQNFPLSYRPFCGYEGANQIADLIYNTFTLGMEDHLLEIFGGHDTTSIVEDENLEKNSANETNLTWSPEAKTALAGIPGFVRNKIKRNTEQFAVSQNTKNITLEIMYAAKEAVV